MTLGNVVALSGGFLLGVGVSSIWLGAVLILQERNRRKD